MTRTEVEEILKNGGVEPTKEMIDAFLNKHNAEIQKEKALSDKYKNDAIKVSDLEAQLEALNNQNLSEIDLAKKETEKSNSKVAELEKKLRDMEMKNNLAGIGIVGEDADKLFGADGSLDTSILGRIISAREESAKSLKEKELLNNTPNPTGSNNNNGTKTEVERMAETVGKNIANHGCDTQSILSNYTK